MRLDMKDASRLASIAALTRINNLEFAREIASKMKWEPQEIALTIIALGTGESVKDTPEHIVKAAGHFLDWAKLKASRRRGP